jgi:hypothetical protein
MANWDFVFAYDSRATDWLAEQGLPYPAVRPGNRLPCTSEVAAAWRRHDSDKLLLIDDFDWNDEAYVPEDAFKLRGDELVELAVLVELCVKCGQLWMYRDTGAPAIVVDASLDLERTMRLHMMVSSCDDSWERFYREMYG